MKIIIDLKCFVTPCCKTMSHETYHYYIKKINIKRYKIVDNYYFLYLKSISLYTSLPRFFKYSSSAFMD